MFVIFSNKPNPIKMFNRFLDAYKANGVPIWGLTIDNEPKSQDPKYPWNSLGLTPELERDFIKMDLGPILEKAGYGRNTTDLMIFDDQRDQINHFAEIILKDKDAAKYVSGTAFHWYEDRPENLINLDKTLALDPTKYILETEACEEMRKDSFGSWRLFERYANDIITVNKLKIIN
jgi:glucosylceramidase